MSEVILDTITGKSTATTITIGSTPVVSASANSMTIRGEGSNQTSIQQGLAKVWALNNQSVTHSNPDSFNVSGLTDVKAGGTTETFTNNMASGNYAATFCSGYGTIDDASLYAVKYNAPTNNMVTTGISFTWYYGSHGTTSKQAADCTHIGMTITGDLA